MTIACHGFYSVPNVGFTDKQRLSYVFGAHQDAHVRSWYAQQRLKACEHITTDSLLEALRGPTPAAIKAKCQRLRDSALNNPNMTPLDYVNVCRFADKQEAKELRELNAVRKAMEEV